MEILQSMKCNVSYVGMHECYMDFVQNLHEKNVFFMGKKLVVVTCTLLALYDRLYHSENFLISLFS